MLSVRRRICAGRRLCRIVHPPQSDSAGSATVVRIAHFEAVPLIRMWLRAGGSDLCPVEGDELASVEGAIVPAFRPLS